MTLPGGMAGRSAHDNIEAFILSYDEVVNILSCLMYCQGPAKRQYAGLLL